MTQQSAVVAGNHENHDYEIFLARFNKRFLDNLGTAALFTTDAEELWEAYLDAFQ